MLGCDEYDTEKRLESFAGTNWIGEVVRSILYGHDQFLDNLSKNLPPRLLGLTYWKRERRLVISCFYAITLTPHFSGKA